tara:strand:- start:1013 stop:2167 length:1155 start_codon:yes stop_codon:yes gene_type:complete
MLRYSQLSFWEKDSYFNDLDILIIGAGIVGYSAAIELKDKYPDKKILILERGYLPTGASTKNAGFTCFGSGSEILDDLEDQEQDKVVDLIRQRYEGLQILLNRCGKDSIDFIQTGSFEIFKNSDEDVDMFENVMDNQRRLNDIIEEATGIKNNYTKSSNTFGFDNVSNIVKNYGEGQIDTGKMMLKLHQIAVQKGVLTLFGTSLESFEDFENDLVKINTENGAFLTKELIVATNGLSQSLLPDIDLKPARAQVLITKPIPDLFNGTFHYDRGYYYFRNVGNRLLIGGGRNLAFEEETTTDFENTAIITNSLKKLINDVILPNKKIEIEQQWSGIMGVGKSRNPIVRYISEKRNVMVAIRLGGMGVALGSRIGQQIATLFEKKNS